MQFLAADWRLLELEQGAAASLTQAWEMHFGYPPDFSERGNAVTGYHDRDDNAQAGELQVLVSHRANAEAFAQALRVLRVRYALETISVVNRPLGWATTTNAVDEDDWEPELEERPYDLAAVSVWPPEPTHPVRDQVLIEHVGQPRRFVHTLTQHACCRPDYGPAEFVETPRTFQCAEAARRWIAEFGGDRPLRIVYRSVALAAEDQAAREVVEEMRG